MDKGLLWDNIVLKIVIISENGIYIMFKYNQFYYKTLNKAGPILGPLPQVPTANQANSRHYTKKMRHPI